MPKISRNILFPHASRPLHAAGHHDGGYLVCSTYSKLAEHRALARTRLAIDAYQRRIA